MAIKLIANYSKKAGLPGYSSHQFAISVETELTDLGAVQGEATRLYSLLQDAVDREIQHVGFVPDEVYGMEPSNNPPASFNGTSGPKRETASWKCSDKQRELILKLVTEHDLDRNVIEELAIERFGQGVKALNKLQASGLIDEILELHGGTNRRSNGNHRGGNGSNGSSPRSRARSTAGKGGRS